VKSPRLIVSNPSNTVTLVQVIGPGKVADPLVLKIIEVGKPGPIPSIMTPISAPDQETSRSSPLQLADAE
jgi:hypothetical protein